MIDPIVLDLSNHDQATFDPECLYASGVRRVIIAGERATSENQIRQCSAAGIDVIGLYVYLYFAADYMARVNMAIRLATDFGVPYVWLDCEDDGGTVASRQAAVRQGVASIEANGLRAGIYCGGYWWPPMMGNTTEFSRLPLWHAQYGVASGPRPPVTAVAYGGWTAPHIHQYTSTMVRCGRNRDHNYYLRPLPGVGEIEDDNMDARVEQIIAIMADMLGGAPPENTQDAWGDRLAALTGQKDLRVFDQIANQNTELTKHRDNHTEAGVTIEAVAEAFHAGADKIMEA